MEISELNPSLSTTTCPLCHKPINIITDHNTTESICINCGCVLTEKLLDAKMERDLIKDDIYSKVIINNSNNCNNRSPSPLVRQGMGLATVIGKINKDALGQQIDANMKNKINRLRLWDTRSQLQNSKERNLYTAFIQLQRLNDDLGLPDSVIEKAAYIYKKIQQNKITNGTSIKIVIASALYIACRELDIPRTLKEISAISNTDEKKSFRFYRKTILELDLKVPQADPLRMVVKIANMCKTSEKAKRYALKMMDELIKKKLFTSKDPMGLAGAIVYLASKKTGDHIVQYHIANATGITLITLRKNLRFLDKCLK